MNFSFFNVFAKFLIPFLHIVFVKTRRVWNSFHFSLFRIVFFFFFSVCLFSFVLSRISIAATSHVQIIISSQRINQRQIQKLIFVFPIEQNKKNKPKINSVTLTLLKELTLVFLINFHHGILIICVWVFSASFEFSKNDFLFRLRL